LFGFGVAKTVNAQNGCLLTAEREVQALNIVEALTLFHRAEAADCDPDLCAAGRWKCHMLLGDFERAWCESDQISARGKPDPNRFWNGCPLNGNRVLIRCLHGFGDTIQFIRYAVLVRRIARHLIIEAQPEIKGLICDSQIADQVITWTEHEPEWDQQVEIMELPRIFRTTLQTIPRDVPYLSVRGVQKRRQSSVSEPLKVGIVWSSSTYNRARSIPIEELAQIFALPGLKFYALQYGPEHNNVRRYPAVHDLHHRLITIEDTARIMCGLDLVITVDTMAAHLAGALAIPVWMLLPYECDWRWMLNREDSPWYPTMRLFRQPSPGNWNAAVRRIKAELQALIGGVHQNGSDPYCPAAGTVK
jgi:hypothetical protein